MEEIESNGVKIYPLPDCDSDEDEDYKEQVYQVTLVLLILHLDALHSEVGICAF
jgi:hypothetical protein